jgi:hypothetical protein
MIQCPAPPWAVSLVFSSFHPSSFCHDDLSLVMVIVLCGPYSFVSPSVSFAVVSWQCLGFSSCEKWAETRRLAMFRIP